MRWMRGFTGKFVTALHSKQRAVLDMGYPQRGVHAGWALAPQGEEPGMRGRRGRAEQARRMCVLGDGGSNKGWQGIQAYSLKTTGQGKQGEETGMQADKIDWTGVLGGAATRGGM